LFQELRAVFLAEFRRKLQTLDRDAFAKSGMLAAVYDAKAAIADDFDDAVLAFDGSTGQTERILGVLGLGHGRGTAVAQDDRRVTSGVDSRVKARILRSFDGAREQTQGGAPGQVPRALGAEATYGFTGLFFFGLRSVFTS